MPWIEVVPITNPNAIKPFKMDDVIQISLRFKIIYVDVLAP